MKKVNNHGFTLIEMLLALAILSIFMVTVIFFMFTESRSTKVTKQQIQTQQEAGEAYNTVSDLIMQATSVDVRTQDDRDIMSQAAVNSINYTIKDQNITTWAFYTGANGYKCAGVGTPSTYRKDSLNKRHPMTDVVSRPEYEAAKLYLNNQLASSDAYEVFNKDATYNVKGLYLGPVITDNTTTPTQYKTIVYNENKKAIYLNTDSNGIDLSTNDDNIIAEHCGEFKAAVDSAANSLTIRLTFSNAGYSYSTGGTVVIRNGGVLN